MTVVQFPKGGRQHVRASAGSGSLSTAGRAASDTIKSASTPAAFATSVNSTADHQSDGIASRRFHLDTCDRVAPMSDMAASIEGHRSITAENVVGLDIDSCLGQDGLLCKANMARDLGPEVSDNPAVIKRPLTETEEKDAFIARVRLARMARFPDQKPICTILGIDQGTYKHYEDRTPLPHRFIPKFVAATGVSFEWLLANDGAAPVALPEAVKPKRKPRKVKAKAA